MRHLEPWFVGKAIPRAGADDAILKHFWSVAQAALDQLPEALPDGLFEAENGVRRVQGYRNDGLALACLRVVDFEGGKRSRLHTVELLLAHPLNKPALIAVRAWCTRLEGTRIDSSEEVPGVWKALAAAHCFQEDADHAHMPYFDEIVATVHQGSTSNPVEAKLPVGISAEEFDEVVSECSYFRELALKQANTLREMETKVRFLQEALTLKEGEDGGSTVIVEQRPRSLEDLLLWASQHQDDIVLHARAFVGAKRSLYQDEEAIFAALDFLAGPYRLHRSGQIGLEAYQAELARADFRFAGSASYTTATAQGEAYFVRYNGRREFLDMHLLKGGGRDPRYCLRIYFFWDPEAAKVVVGWLPSHLDNSLT